MKKSLFVNLLIACFFSLSLTAQSNPNWEYWVTGKVEVKRGASVDFEKTAALKTKKYNNTLETAITTYKVMDGPDQGKYERIQGYKDINWFNSNMSSSAGTKFWMKNCKRNIAS